jgi:hypothetical protein
MKQQVLVAVMLLSLLMLTDCGRENEVERETQQFDAQIIQDWGELQLKLIKTSSGYAAPVAARVLAYSSLTMYESLAPFYSQYQSLSGQINQFNRNVLPGPGQEYYPPAVLNAALHHGNKVWYDNASSSVLPAIDTLYAYYQQLYRANIAEEVIQRSENHGQELAQEILEYAEADGGFKAYNVLFPAYDPPAGPDKWIPEDIGQALLPYWQTNRSFVKDLLVQVEPSPPPAYSEDTSSDFYQNARQVFEISQNLSSEEETIAFFWTDDPQVTYTPAGHFYHIALQAAQEEELDLIETATVLAKVGMAQNDAMIASWDTKYKYNLLRPSTYIRKTIDPFWSTLIINPPFPEYTSGHSCQSAAAAEVLTQEFGDQYAFTDYTHDELDLGLSPRSYDSFYQAAEEAGMSRLYGGIHYMFGNVQGREQGYAVGRLIGQLQFATHNN